MMVTVKPKSLLNPVASRLKRVIKGRIYRFGSVRPGKRLCPMADRSYYRPLLSQWSILPLSDVLTFDA